MESNECANGTFHGYIQPQTSEVVENKHLGTSFQDHMAETIEEHAELIEKLTQERDEFASLMDTAQKHVHILFKENEELFKLLKRYQDYCQCGVTAPEET